MNLKKMSDDPSNSGQQGSKSKSDSLMFRDRVSKGLAEGGSIKYFAAFGIKIVFEGIGASVLGTAVNWILINYTSASQLEQIFGVPAGPALHLSLIGLAWQQIWFCTYASSNRWKDYVDSKNHESGDDEAATGADLDDILPVSSSSDSVEIED